MGQGRGAARGNTGAQLPCSAAPRALELEDGYAARKTRRKSQKQEETSLRHAFSTGFVWRTGVKKIPQREVRLTHAR